MPELKVVIPMTPPLCLTDFRVKAETEYFLKLLELRELNQWTVAELGRITGLRRENIYKKLHTLGIGSTQVRESLCLRWGGIKSTRNP